ncbi:lipase member I-like [Halyomorpha halys]|uniref:lipase member I-like n=1 Tax=Halyomorpha halys TaxID=286706 RepID=UPI0034D35CC3
MSTGRDNLIVVDWSSLAAGPWYHSAVANTKVVAKWLAGVIDSLVIRGLPLESFHVIGFSLGAEIAGLTAKKISVGKLRRVTGLDPALPLFHIHQKIGRLDAGDANFVDVIHTDGGVFGFEVAIGHADFFPNGGKPAQPGCKIESVIHTGKLNEFVACSHNRAWRFYAESVKNPYAFPAYECHDYHAFQAGLCPPKGKQAYMGYLADPSLRGTFFLDTLSNEPYGYGIHEDGAYHHNHLHHSHHSNHSHSASQPGIDLDLLPLSLLESKGRFRGLRGMLNKTDEEDTQYDREGKEMKEAEEEAPENYEEEVEAVAAMYEYLVPTIGDSPDLEFHFLPYHYGRETTESTEAAQGDVVIEDAGEDGDTTERELALDESAIESILNIFNMDEFSESNT